MAVSPSSSLEFDTDEFNLNEMLGSLFSLIKLLQKEFLFPLGKGFYRAQRDDKSCVWLSHKIPFGQIIDSSVQNFTLDSTPLATNLRQLDQDLFLVHHTSTSFMNGEQFRKMAEKLGLKLSLLWDPGRPETSFITVYRETGGTLVLGSYDPTKPLACLLDANGLTLQFMVKRVFQRLHSLWSNLERILRFYRLDMPECLELNDFSMGNIASLTSSVLETCLEELAKGRGMKKHETGAGSRKGRKKRSLLGLLFGNDGRLNTIEKTLKQSVHSYNKNLRKISKFDGEVHRTLVNIVSAEQDLTHQLAALSHQVQTTTAKQTFFNAKISNMELLRNMAMDDKLELNLSLLARALLGNTLCTLKSCEKTIQAKIAPAGRVEVVRQILQLRPETRWLVQCELGADGMISSLHDQDGVLQGESLLVNNNLIGLMDLKNKSFTEKTLKLVPEEQLLLGGFHHYRDSGITILQCPRMLTFQLDGKTIKCKPLQKIPLPTNFRLQFQGRELTAHHLLDTSSRFKDWMTKFSFGNIDAFERPKPITPVILHPALDDLFFTPLKTFKKEAIWGFGIGATLLVLGISLLCYCYCLRFKQLVHLLLRSLLNAAWSFLPAGSKEKYEAKKRDKRMMKDLKRVKKLKAMIRNRRNLEQLQKQRREKAEKRGEPAKETAPGEAMEIVPSAPPQDDIVVLEVIPEEKTNAKINVEAKTVSFKKNQA